MMTEANNNTDADVNKPNPDNSAGNNAGDVVSYTDFKFDEGKEINKDVLEKLKTLGKANNVKQEGMQSFIDTYSVMESQATSAKNKTISEQRTKWKDELKSDSEYGGDNYEKTLSLAKKTMQNVGSSELRDLMNDKRFEVLGDNPAMIKFFAKIGNVISEDAFETGAGKKQEKKDVERSEDGRPLLSFPSMQKK